MLNLSSYSQGEVLLWPRMIQSPNHLGIPICDRMTCCYEKPQEIGWFSDWKWEKLTQFWWNYDSGTSKISGKKMSWTKTHVPDFGDAVFMVTVEFRYHLCWSIAFIPPNFTPYSGTCLVKAVTLLGGFPDTPFGPGQHLASWSIGKWGYPWQFNENGAGNYLKIDTLHEITLKILVFM